MKRSYEHVKKYEAIVFEMKEAGRTNGEIAEELGFSKEQLKNLIKRHNRRNREQIIPRRRGRPRNNNLETIQQLQRENQRLQMENELLRDFLKETERG